MVARTEYKDRFAEAMRHAGMDERAIAARLKVTYQAVKKVLNGTTKMLKANNNAVAAQAMGVNSHWLATGEGPMLATRLPVGLAVEVDTAFQLDPKVGPPPAAAFVDAVLALPAARWPSVRAQLDQVVAHPELRDEVVAELMPLLAAPSTKHRLSA